MNEERNQEINIDLLQNIALAKELKSIFFSPETIDNLNLNKTYKLEHAFHGDELMLSIEYFPDTILRQKNNGIIPERVRGNIITVEYISGKATHRSRYGNLPSFVQDRNDNHFQLSTLYGVSSQGIGFLRREIITADEDEDDFRVEEEIIEGTDYSNLEEEDRIAIRKILEDYKSGLIKGHYEYLQEYNADTD